MQLYCIQLAEEFTRLKEQKVEGENEEERKKNLHISNEGLESLR